MTTLNDIKEAVNCTLKQIYPEYKIYGADTIEGYRRPSFFVYVTQTFSEATKNAVHKNVEIEVDYIQKSPDESDAMKFFEKMEKAFYHKLKLRNGRQLTTDGHSQEFQGTYNNIPCYFFNVEFWSEIEAEKDDIAIMKDLKINEEVKE